MFLLGLIFLHLNSVCYSVQIICMKTVSFSFQWVLSLFLGQIFYNYIHFAQWFIYLYQFRLMNTL